MVTYYIVLGNIILYVPMMLTIELTVIIQLLTLKDKIITPIRFLLLLNTINSWSDYFYLKVLSFLCMLPLLIFFILTFIYYTESSTSNLVHAMFLVILILESALWLYELKLLKRER